MMSNNERFLKNYKILEVLLEEYYGMRANSHNSSSIIRYYHELRKSYSFRDRERAVKLDTCRTIRNTMAHENVNDAITVTDDFVKFLEDEIKLLVDPVTAEQVALNINRAFTCTLEDDARKVMEVMVRRGFSHVPVMENGNLYGVFSQKIIFQWLYYETATNIKKGAKIKDFAAYLPIKAHTGERYVFVKKDETINEITRMFEESRGHKVKIGLIFVTEHGKKSEKIIGFITPYDLIYY